MLSCVMSFAQDEQDYPVITGLGNGKFIITVNAAGQINGMDLTSETYSALATASEIRIVTEGDTQLSSNDMTRLCSDDFSMNTLDLEYAQVAGATTNGNNNGLKKLHNAPSTLKNIVFPIQDGMIIPNQCFQRNTKIESIVIPDYPSGKTYKIGSGAFENATGLLRASIGKGTSSLGGDPIPVPSLEGKEMANYDENEHPNGVTVYDLTHLENGQEIPYYQGEGGGVFSGCTNLYSLVLDDDITCIRASAFQNCSKIEFIQLPKNLTTLGPNSFAGCSSVTTVVLPEKLRFIGQSVFQGMGALSDVYLLAEDIPLPFGGNNNPIFVTSQTNEFNYVPADEQGEPTYSQADYQPKQHQTNPMAILHYPGTATARNNYRWPNHEYRLVDDEGTTWPNQQDITEFQAYAITLNDGGLNANDIFKGWKYFLQGNMNEKRDDIYDITRFKESRWYSVCFPFDLTVDKFQNAFGARAALSEFVGFTFDSESQSMTIHFDVAAIPNNNQVILKANHAYMIHPSRLVVSDDEPIQIFNVNNLMDHYRMAEVLIQKQQIYDTWVAAVAAYDAFVAEYGDHGHEAERKPLRDAMNNAKKLWDEWAKVKDDATVDTENLALNQKVWYSGINDKDEAGEYRVRRYALPSELQNDVTYYFRGNYIEKPSGERFANSTLQDKKLPAGCYYLGGLTETFYHRKKEGSKWTPFTAILDAGSESTGDPTLAPTISFVAEDAEVTNENGEQATGIDTKLFINIPLTNTGKVFNMQGQQVSNKGIEGLPKGMYIMNGKKYVVK